MFHIAKVNKNDAELGCLVSELDAFQRELYPAESSHCLDLSAASDEKIVCIIAKDEYGIPAGCGALLIQQGGFGEVKRVYIRPAFRGRKLGVQIVAALENLASETHCRRLRLETGIHQHAAIALYRRCGYAVCEPFPPYAADPLSVFMSKDIQAAME